MRISDWSSDCALPISGEVATPADVVALMQSGALPIAGELRRLEVDSEDEAAVESLRAYCPPREGDEEIDLQVAHQLLEEPALYARPLHGVADPAASAAPAAAGSGHFGRAPWRERG